MNQEEIEFFEKIWKEYVNVITDAKFVGGSSSEGPKPLTILFEDDLVLMSNITLFFSKVSLSKFSLEALYISWV